MISFVYFDLGGVVEKDFSNSNKWQDLQRELGIKDSDTKKFQDFWKKYEKDICTHTDAEALIPLLEKEFSIAIPKDYSLCQAFVKRFEKNPSIWPVISFIQKNCRIGLLTNMYMGMLDRIVESGILPDVIWDSVIDSSKVGFAKPDKIIYRIAKEKAGTKDKEILFVENNVGSVEAAKELGWQTFHYDSADYDDSSKKLEKYFIDNYQKIR